MAGTADWQPPPPIESDRSVAALGVAGRHLESGAQESGSPRRPGPLPGVHREHLSLPERTDLWPVPCTTWWPTGLSYL